MQSTPCFTKLLKMDILLHTYSLKVPFFLKNVRHTGIEVFGKEYTFSMSGITICHPRKSKIGIYERSYTLAHVQLTDSQFGEILDALGKIYRPNTYNFIYKNCNHFCDDLFHLLCGRRLFFQFMVYSRLGKVLGKMKAIGFCGTYNTECSSSDDLIYQDVSKLSKSMIKENAKMKSFRGIGNMNRETSLVSGNYDNRFSNLPCLHASSTTCSVSSPVHIVPPKNKIPRPHWYSDSSITKTVDTVPAFYNNTITNCKSNRTRNITKMENNLATIAVNDMFKVKFNSIKQQNPEFRTINSLSTACSLEKYI